MKIFMEKIEKIKNVEKMENNKIINPNLKTHDQNSFW